jgi:hypothetical protein
MSLTGAFTPMGNCVAVQAATANTQSAVTTITANSPCQQYLLSNMDTANTAFVQISTSSSFNVAVPTNVAGQNVVPILPYDTQVVSWYQVNASTPVYARVISYGTANVYITPGEGVL